MMVNKHYLLLGLVIAIVFFVGALQLVKNHVPPHALPEGSSF